MRGVTDLGMDPHTDSSDTKDGPGPPRNGSFVPVPTKDIRQRCAVGENIFLCCELTQDFVGTGLH